MYNSSKVVTILSVLFLVNVVFCDVPLVINTWGFTNATKKAWEILNDPDKTYIDALVEGCSVCETEQCDGTVGYGGSPDENGETTLDAMIMDGVTMNMGAVGALRRVKDAISVARHVLENTRHSFLIGDLATDFAQHMGFDVESLTTPKSKSLWKDWKSNSCQPNFWTNVLPNPKTSCGPYRPDHSMFFDDKSRKNYEFGQWNHDTIGMIVIDENKNVAAGTSTNGASHKIPGRVGDSPIPGAGAYADSEVGAAAATGDGDIMMRFLPAFLAVEKLRDGKSPTEAGRIAIGRIIKHYPEFMGGIVVATHDGDYGAACHGISKFPFSVFKKGSTEVTVEHVSCEQ